MFRAECLKVSFLHISRDDNCSACLYLAYPTDNWVLVPALFGHCSAFVGLTYQTRYEVPWRATFILA